MALSQVSNGVMNCIAVQACDAICVAGLSRSSVGRKGNMPPILEGAGRRNLLHPLLFAKGMQPVPMHTTDSVHVVQTSAIEYTLGRIDHGMPCKCCARLWSSCYRIHPRADRPQSAVRICTCTCPTAPAHIDMTVTRYREYAAPHDRASAPNITPYPPTPSAVERVGPGSSK